MASVSSSIKKELYKVEITSPTGNVVIADEPTELGGGNKGFSPTELLASALAACTSATLRMYADRKGWQLDEVKIDVKLHRDNDINETHILTQLELIGNLDDQQRERLMQIAGKCPVNKILSNPIRIEGQLIK